MLIQGDCCILCVYKVVIVYFVGNKEEYVSSGWGECIVSYFYSTYTYQVSVLTLLYTQYAHQM
mgnify:FL=1